MRQTAQAAFGSPVKAGSCHRSPGYAMTAARHRSTVAGDLRPLVMAQSLPAVSQVTANYEPASGHASDSLCGRRSVLAIFPTGAL